MAVGSHEPEASRLMLRVAPQRVFHNPKRQRGIAQAGRWLRSSEEESLADASGYERSAGIKTNWRAACVSMRVLGHAF